MEQTKTISTSLTPPNYAYLEQEMARLSRCRCALTGSIGRSVCGRRIYSISFGETRQRVLFAAAFHGMEWITELLMLRFAHNLCSALENHTTIAGEDPAPLLARRGLCILPCVNPDGVEIQLRNPERRWQANARGVDLNHNFNAGWCELRQQEIEAGITKPGRTRFGGPRPESEPETAAVANLCRILCFCQAIAFHSQGEVIYYDFGKHTPPCSLEMAQALAGAAGYTVAAPEGLAVGGGFKDWFIDCLRRPGFTVEVGMGENPLPIEQTDAIYRQIEPMLMKALRL